VTSTDTSHSCIPARTLARLAEGTLPRPELAAVLAHLQDCADCMEVLATANDVLAMEAKRTGTAPAPIRQRWGLTLAAAAIITIVAVLAVRAPWSPFRPADGIARLARLAPRTERLVEPRLSGGFAWAEYRGPDRATEDELNATRLKLGGAAGEAVERAQSDPSADAQHTAGVAMLLVGQPETAVRTLRTAVERAPEDAGAWSDLAAAQYAAAVRFRRASLYPEALAAADHALRIDPKQGEALFNRALILQKLGLREEARAAWQHYLEVDPSSAWATEAQRYLKEIPAVDQDAEFRKELPRLEAAAAGSDAARVRQFVAAYPQQARTWGEGVHLAGWAAAEQKGDAAEAAKMLTVARTIGDALRGRGEMLLGDAVAAIDVARGAQRAALAEAHVTYKRGRMLYAQQKPTEAAAALGEAAKRFEEGRSPMALMARYFAANTAYDRQQIAQATRDLTHLLDLSRRHRGYGALQAQIDWQLAMCAIATNAFSDALPMLRDGEAIFVRAGETRNAGTMAGLMAAPLTATGRLDEAWDAHIRSFSLLSESGNRERLVAGLGSATRMELRVRRLDAARSIAQIETTMARTGGNDLALVDALVRHTMISEELGDHAAAQHLVAEAAAAAARLGDPQLRARSDAEVQFATGAVLLTSDPLRAREHLTRAIDGYLAGQHSVQLPEAYLLRARAAARLHDSASAARDLDLGIEELEREPVRFAGTVVGTGVLDAGRTLYEDAVGLRLDLHDEAGAFAVADRACAQLSPRPAKTPSLDDLRQLLVGSNTAVLELVALPEEVVAFCITEREVLTTRTRIDLTRLESLIAHHDGAALFDVLIRPSLPVLSAARSLVLVTGSSLRNVPFGGLTDRASNQPLIARMAVVSAPSVATLQRDEPSSRPAALLAVVLPSGDASATLPDSDNEIGDLRGVYPDATILRAEQATFGAFGEAAPRATIVHISGHTARESAEEERSFVFAANERVSWQTVAATPLARDSLVVLAACETLRAAASSQERSLSLGEAFLAAGARGVFGTLTPIADRDARALFVALHRQLASGTPAHVALRNVQLEAAARGDSRAWQSVVLMTNRIPPPR
jgi:tetratricopeptide (TPR) repeat protein